MDAVAAPRRPNWILLTALFLFVGLVETAGVSHNVTYNFRLLQGFGMAPDEIKALIGVLGSLPFLLGLPLAPFWGTWADTYSRRAIIARSAILEAVLFAGLALSRNVTEMVAAASLAGLVLGNTGVMLAVLSEVAPRQRVGLALAIAGAASPLGFAFGPLLGGLLIDGGHLGDLSWPAFGLRGLFWMDCTLSALSAVALFVFFHEPPRPPRTTRSVFAQVRSALALILHSPALRILFVIAILGRIAESLTRSYLPLFIDTLYGGNVPNQLVGLIVGTGAAALGLAAPLWGALGDRVGHARLLPLSAGLAACGLALLASASSITMLWPIWILTGAVQAGLNPLFYTLIAVRAPETQRATVLTFAYFPLYFGGVFGPALGAVLARTGLPLAAEFIAAATSVALASAVAVVAWRVSQAEPKPST